ncbi:MAG TPA: glycosyltransferase family 4 protein [Chitinophagaceae bacterium]|nr:glycosyltransferase family 4 protein [Chitinophagaceae bacterium]
MKILFISHRFYPEIGGIETNAEILASGFCNLGADVHLVTWTKAKNGKQFPFTVIRNPGIKQLLKEHRWADVILENNPSLRLSWPNLFLKKPLVIALNTWVTRLNGEKGFRDKLKYAWFKRAKKMIAVSDAVRKREWPEAVVIENPYNNDLFLINPAINKIIPFVFLGRLVSDKGADQAIRAVAALVEEHVLSSNFTQLTIIGEGPERKKLEVLVKELKLNKVVNFVGAMRGKDLANCLNHHQYILVPSSWEEPYGNVVLEAMACGCIPVASNGGGLPEAVGKAGFLFKRNDTDEMINLLKKIFKNELKTDAVKNESADHLKEHSMEKVSRAYLNILMSAVK